ncbi:nuclear transport factor 2 family protein [Saccharophagus degradans]|uniref:nuclear transport factor 2 family protein n=1 Tax=Saccharophagus degradans TaxID=86304 RepID=UPI002477D123|nr:nuclear transport factor 2 family protein [Saccharophagus degradans]WGP00059.1 nuclear transport factor 2 family protein [Saccharophagus degradans]
MKKLVDDIIQLYCEFDHANLDALGDIYHRNIVFVDPVHRLKGLDDLVSYFKSTMQGTSECAFSFSSPILDGTNACLEWQMHYRHPKLKGGDRLTLDGVSRVQIAGEQGADMRIIYQRDYYDLGAMLYEHIPVLGRVVGSLKNRLAVQ